MQTLSLISPNNILQADVSCAGGILTSLRKMLDPDGAMELLYQAPWINENSMDGDIPPLMQQLAGEWVGVPFGCVAQDDSLFFRNAPHGLPVNGEWYFTASTSHDAAIRYDYPIAYPLSHLERHIALTDDSVNFSLTITARRNCRFPLGLHPIFPIGGDAGAVDILVSGDGMVYPQATEPGVSRLIPSAHFTSLRDVPLLGGAMQDISHLPLPYNTEEIVQLLAPQGLVTLRYPQRRLQLTLKWDSELLPHCLLWISNGGRSLPPWNGRNYCLGVEPICSAWDLGPESLASPPITRHCAPTSVNLMSNEVLTLSYQLHCSEIN
ncbi:hypothetical protein EU691_01295 [Salmonella enterica]|nr:hypothetical protein [Salmonella enterica]EAV1332786.1 hypothetical protein [Salmonella enterica]EBK5291123.1 hypothetical protein [Salmonella enterica]ESG98879.1 hypothetical protein SEEI1959_03540 [Salmonella enterica subsp. enterica serovar Indiana str. ATCC 51959]